MSAAGRPEIWGGLECSVVRVGDDVRNQVLETGHQGRPGDLDLIADLGIRTLRYPVLWETVGKVQGERNWGWHDFQLHRLRKLGISPIAGLVHHGSGPDYCDVLDPDFPEGLARHAGDVARRYPWIDLFTPVNEPMTTARLCGLYGHWYPHGRDEVTCFRVLIAECRATAASMKEIRRLIPAARLVQTEDIGRVFSTPLLEYQTDHENERRWLALDLLAGRVDRHHPFHRRLLEHGIEERHLAELADAPCPPDIIGIDQYLTSDRFLDERLERYPEEIEGGNGRHVYVDVAAVRAGVAEEETGFLPRIREAWDRYGLPLALTEVHNGCTREEQLRWLIDGWNAASAARAAGIDLRAISIWSLFGATDWNSLLTRREEYYEPGAFDVRFTPPKPTIIAAAARGLAESGSFDHPVLDRPGWWKTEARPPEEPSRPIMLADSHMGPVVAARCALRRIDLIDFAQNAAGAVTPPSAAWAVVVAESGFGAGRGRASKQPLRLTCRYMTVDFEDVLVVEATHLLDPVHVVDAFLDLAIDGATGRFRVARAGPCRQYVLELMDDGAGQPIEATKRRASGPGAFLGPSHPSPALLNTAAGSTRANLQKRTFSKTL